MSSGRRTARPRDLARAALALALAVVGAGAPARVARADVVGPEDEACLQQREGESCDERYGLYRGRCVRQYFSEGRSRLRCWPPGDQHDLQIACVGYAEGETCYRPSGAEGVCAPGELRRMQPFGGGAEKDLPVLECRRVPRDWSGEDRAGMLLVGGTTSASLLFAAGTWLLQRRRDARAARTLREPPEPREPRDADQPGSV
jgi:hypothetical protein